MTPPTSSPSPSPSQSPSPLSLEPLPQIERVATPAGLTAAALDAVVAGGGRLPLVDTDTCTFAYRGAVIGVRLVHFGVGFPADLSFRPLGGSDWWVLSLAVPAGSRLEYKLEVTDSFGTHLVADPANPNEATHPFGANSVCEAHGYEQPAWAGADPSVPAGRVVEFVLDSAAFGRRVNASIYLPAQFSPRPSGPYPLLVVHDGSDYLQYASAQAVLDNLIHQREMPPAVVCFLHPEERLVEYADDPRQARLLTQELVPELEAELPLVGAVNGRCLLGASFGAVSSLAAARRAPGYFGRLALQSGSFAGAGQGCKPRPEPLWRPVRTFVQGFLAQPTAVAERVFVSCGAYESLICENRALVPVLAQAGMGVRFVEHLDGHNWTCWRDGLGVALPWLFGPTG